LGPPRVAVVTNKFVWQTALMNKDHAERQLQVICRELYDMDKQLRKLLCWAV
jgi:hypothetical protein